MVGINGNCPTADFNKQKSFAEYHNKRNPVERVHAVENRVLSNEVFSSTAVHKEYGICDKLHLANMEFMAGGGWHYYPKKILILLNATGKIISGWKICLTKKWSKRAGPTNIRWLF